MKYERLIHIETSTDIEVYLSIVRVLFKDQKANISEVGL